MNPYSDPFDDDCDDRPRRAVLDNHLYSRLWLRCFIGLSTVVSAVAQAPLVFERESGQFPSAPVSPEPVPTPVASGHSPSVSSSRGRPAFIPASTPPPPQSAPYDTAGRQGAPSDTIITQIEVPVPPQTAEPLDIPATSPAPASRNNDAVFLRENPSASRRSSFPATQTGNAATAHRSSTFANASQAQEPAPLRDASSTVQPYEVTSDPGSPTIIYDKGQKAVPQEPAVEAPPPPDPGLMLKQRRYSEVESIAMATSDSKLASAIGWSHYQQGQTNRAYGWFEKAIQWDDANYEAAYGMALSLYKMGRYEQAGEVARWRVNEYPKMKKILADLSTRRAVSSFQGKDYKRSREILLGIKRQRGLTREEQIMLAWDAFHLGDVEQARADFVRLYRAKPDRYTADGVYAAYAKTRNWSGLEELAQTTRGPLEALYRRHVSEQYYSYGLYRKAYAESPEKYPDLQNISSPAVGAEVIGRSRSGTAGTSQLTEYSARLNGTVYANDLHRFDVSIGISDLDSGSLDQETPIGQVPKDSSKGYKYTPTTRYDALFDARLRYEHEGLLTPSIELGITPTGGAVDPTFVGALGLRKTEDWGNWTAQVYRDPVKDSLLSYTGLRDPYTGKTWGRVTETGARFSIYSQFQSNWGFYAAASAGMRSGEAVDDNPHVSLSLALSRSLDIPGFEYFVLGPSLGLEFYDKNLSGFTYGQGGYFSPSHLVQGMISTRFLTPQGNNSLIRGVAGIGIQNNNQDSTPWFPGNPDDGRWITGASKTGATLLVDVEGLYQLSPQWTAGAGIAFNLAPDYNDFSLRLSLRYFFEPRKGLYVQDFLTF